MPIFLCSHTIYKVMILKIYNNVCELIGNTPVVRLKKIEKKYLINNQIFAKVERNNPGSSIKDRVAYQMITEAYKKGIINEETTIIEATSGNTGIGLAIVCAYFNLKLIIIMSEDVSAERKKLLEIFGATVILTTKDLGVEGAIIKAKKIKEEITNSYYINQFDNYTNVEAHFNSTGEEIIQLFKGTLDYIFVGMGSGGTIMGISKRIKKNYPYIKIIGIEPKKCPYYSQKEVGEYKIPGIGTTFMPKIVDLTYVDDIVLVTDEDAKKMMLDVAKTEGLGVGYSSGAVLAGLKEYLLKNEIVNKKILVIFPDTIERYLSML